MNGITLELILERRHLSQALDRVERNDGAPGVDGMRTDELRQHICRHPHELTEAIRAGTYRPSPVLRTEIPKEEPGKFRELGIPTVQDRLVQQAIAQVLSFYYDPTFSTRSHGFRPNEKAHNAIYDVLDAADKGYRWVVDMDLEKFFDTINHAKMVQILSERIKDGRVISLIHKFLRADVQLKNGHVEKRDKGAPQGGPLSPILANILLDKLDKEIEARGLRHSRYADDMVIFCKTKRAAERVCASITEFIEKKLLLKVNRDKTKVCYIANSELKFLGYGFYHDRAKHRILPRLHRKTRAKFKKAVEERTQRTTGKSLKDYTTDLRKYIIGWFNFYKLAQFKGWAREIDQWIRRRIRMIYWKRWKKIRTKFETLKKRGIDKQKAWEWANTSKKYWRVACSPILHLALGDAFLEKQGWTWIGLAGAPVEWSAC